MSKYYIKMFRKRYIGRYIELGVTFKYFGNLSREIFSRYRLTL